MSHIKERHLIPEKSKRSFYERLDTIEKCELKLTGKFSLNNWICDICKVDKSKHWVINTDDILNPYIEEI